MPRPSISINIIRNVAIVSILVIFTLAVESCQKQPVFPEDVIKFDIGSAPDLPPNVLISLQKARIKSIAYVKEDGHVTIVSVDKPTDPIDLCGTVAEGVQSSTPSSCELLVEMPPLVKTLSLRGAPRASDEGRCMANGGIRTGCHISTNMYPFDGHGGKIPCRRRPCSR